jgi:hypothetical protein
VLSPLKNRVEPPELFIDDGTTPNEWGDADDDLLKKCAEADIASKKVKQE